MFLFAVNYIIKSLDLKTLFYATKFHEAHQVSNEKKKNAYHILRKRGIS